MRTDEEIIDGRIALRIIAGLLTAAGLFAVFGRIYELAETGLDWMHLLQLIGTAYGLFLFGHFALKGRLPLLFIQNYPDFDKNHTDGET